MGRHSVTVPDQPELLASSWTQYTYNVTGTGTDTVSSRSVMILAYIALDNVSVSASGGGGTTPEPSSFLLLGSGVLAVGGVIRRKLGR